jgi:hypothetical protein
MSKSQPLAIVPKFGPEKAAYHHHHAHLHIAIGAAHAVICGIELQRVQIALGSSDTRVAKGGKALSFDGWLRQNQQVLGFTDRMADRYKAVAQHVKSKMLVNGDEAVLALLDRHPASLSEGESKLILKAVNKAVDGESLRGLLTEMKITRDAQLPDKADPANNGSTKKKVKAAPEQDVYDQLWLPIMGGGDGSLKTVWEPFADLAKAFHKKVNVNGVVVPRWQITSTFQSGSCVAPSLASASPARRVGYIVPTPPTRNLRPTSCPRMATGAASARAYAA